MRIISAVAIACLMLLLASCSSSSSKGTGESGKAKEGVSGKNKELIVGKWEGIVGKWDATDEDSTGATTEFMKEEGIFKKFRLEGPMYGTVEGFYKFLDDNTLEMERGASGDKRKFKVEVAQGMLTTTDAKGKVEKYKRAK